MSGQVNDQISQVLLGKQKDATKEQNDAKASYIALKNSDGSRVDKRAAQKVAHAAADESKAYAAAAEALNPTK